MTTPPNAPPEPAPQLFTALFAAGFNFPSRRVHPFIWVLTHGPTKEHVVLAWSQEYHIFFIKGNPHLVSFREAQRILANVERAIR